MFTLTELQKQSEEIHRSLKVLEINYELEKFEGDSIEVTQLMKQSLILLYKTDSAMRQRITRREQLARTLAISPTPRIKEEDAAQPPEPAGDST